jgi:hypothetical protein
MVFRQATLRAPKASMRKGNEDGGTAVDFGGHTRRLMARSMTMSNQIMNRASDTLYTAGYCTIILRKEVIQPQVPLRLPCYDFTPVADLTVAGCLLAVSAPS